MLNILKRGSIIVICDQIFDGNNKLIMTKR